jgi:hypothetical protein
LKVVPTGAEVLTQPVSPLLSNSCPGQPSFMHAAGGHASTDRRRSAPELPVALQPGSHTYCADGMVPASHAWNAAWRFSDTNCGKTSLERSVCTAPRARWEPQYKHRVEDGGVKVQSWWSGVAAVSETNELEDPFYGTDRKAEEGRTNVVAGGATAAASGVAAAKSAAQMPPSLHSIPSRHRLSPVAQLEITVMVRLTWLDSPALLTTAKVSVYTPPMRVFSLPSATQPRTPTVSKLYLDPSGEHAVTWTQIGHNVRSMSTFSIIKDLRSTGQKRTLEVIEPSRVSEAVAPRSHTSLTPLSAVHRW